MDTDNRHTLPKLHAFMLERAKSGDTDAMLHVAIDFLQQSIEDLDESLLDTAEEYLKQAASDGHALSKNLLDGTWSTLKGSYSEEIDKRRGASDTD